MPREKESAVHIGIDYAEAIQAKRELLLCEANFLNIIKKIRAYSTLRRQEFIFKNRIKKMLEEIKIAAEKIDAELPKSKQIEEDAGIEMQKERIKDKLIKLDDINQNKLKEMQIRELNKQKIKQRAFKKNWEIESELEEIKSKLDRLS